MRSLPPIGLLGLLGACTDTPGPGDPGLVAPPHPCESAAREVDVAPPRGSYGDLDDDPALWCGTPPQGGAPYTPVRVRVQGPQALSDGMVLTLVVNDLDAGEELAYTEVSTRMACANVGDSKGFWVGSEVHVRYLGFRLDELGGRAAELTVSATSLDGSVTVVDAWPVELVDSSL